MRSRENQSVASTTLRGVVGLGWLLMLVLGAGGAFVADAVAGPRDDPRNGHQDGGSRPEQRSARENRAPEVRSAPRSVPGPAPRSQIQPYRPPPQQQAAPRPAPAPRSNFAPQPGARPEYRPNNPSIGPQNGSPGYGSPRTPGYQAPNYQTPNYQTPNYGRPNSGAPNYGSPGYRSPDYDGQPNRAPNLPNNRGNQPGQQHLGDWMDRHQGLSGQEKERALRSEPGFARLAPEQQQRLVQRLHDLDNMRPGERDRTLARVENMERLSPQQRDQVRGAAGELRNMPQDRQRVVRRAFQDLRNVPPGLRNSELNSPRFAGQFSPQERSVLGNLLTVEPYQPAPPPQYP